MRRLDWARLLLQRRQFRLMLLASLLLLETLEVFGDAQDRYALPAERVRGIEGVSSVLDDPEATCEAPRRTFDRRVVDAPHTLSVFGGAGEQLHLHGMAVDRHVALADIHEDVPSDHGVEELVRELAERIVARVPAAVAPQLALVGEFSHVAIVFTPDMAEEQPLTGFDQLVPRPFEVGAYDERTHPPLPVVVSDRAGAHAERVILLRDDVLVVLQPVAERRVPRASLDMVVEPPQRPA